MRVQALSQVPRMAPQTSSPNAAGPAEDSTATANQIERTAVKRADLEQAVAKMNQAAQIASNHLSFSIHEETKRLMVSVVDDRTGDVIREIPPHQVLDAAAEMKRMIGILFDVTI